VTVTVCPAGVVASAVSVRLSRSPAAPVNVYRSFWAAPNVSVLGGSASASVYLAPAMSGNVTSGTLGPCGICVAA